MDNTNTYSVSQRTLTHKHTSHTHFPTFTLSVMHPHSLTHASSLTFPKYIISASIFYNLQFKEACFGITHGGVLSGKLFAQRFQKLVYLHLFTELFHEDRSSII